MKSIKKQFQRRTQQPVRKNGHSQRLLRRGKTKLQKATTNLPIKRPR